MSYWGPSASEITSEVRQFRASPPGLAHAAGRRDVFNAALEQFEQLLNAANVVSPAASPLPLFYSFSQAGRAIAAASVPGGEWRFKGHGLSFELAEGASIGESEICPTKSGGTAYAVVSAALDSPRLTSPVSLAEVWAAVSFMKEPEALGGKYSTAVRVSSDTHKDEKDVVRIDDDRVIGLGEKPDAELLDRLEDYPTVRGLTVLYQHTFKPGEHEMALIQFNDGQGETVPVEAVASGFGDLLELRPGLGESRDAVDSVMTLWLAMFAFSCLARYYPDKWVEALNPNQSAMAVPIERALKRWSMFLPSAVLNSLRGIA